MGPFYSNSSGDGDAEDASPAPGAASAPSDDDRDSSSIQSPGFGFPPDRNPADAAASNDGSASASAQSDGSDKSDWSDPSDSPATGADSPTPPTATSAPRQRIPVKPLGQIPEVDNARILAQAPDLATAWQQMAEQENARAQQVSQINQSDPYISPEDGRWKKQSVDYPTGAIQETDILDSGTGKIDRSTGNIYVQTAQGPQVISVDPQQKRLAEIVSQKAQAQPFGQAQGPEPAEGFQGSPADTAIAAAKAALSDTQRQLQAYQGVPERMAAQIAKYTQATLDPNNTAAAAQLQNLQTAFANWKQQNPGYTPLISKRDALANQIQTQTAAKAQSAAQAAQFLTTPQYVQWNGNAPPAPFPSDQGSSTPAADISIHDLDSRAGVIAAQTGYPAGLAYASALQEAKQHGAQTVDGDSIDDAIAAVQPVAEAQLAKMPGPQLRQAYQSGLITRQQLITAVQPRNAPVNQAAAPADEEEEDEDDGETSPLTPEQDADPLAQSIAELNSRAADLRNKIQTAFDTGGADGAKALATYRAALADTEDRLHASAQSLLNRMPADLQKRIANAVAPNVDWNDAAVRNAQDPMVNFATENIGSALRDQSMPPYLQIAIRKFTAARGINPDIADHIANQALGAGAVSDLLRVLRGANIDQGRADTLRDMGLLQPSDPTDPASLPHLTEDALRLLPPGAQRFVQVRPDFAKYTPSTDPAHGSALYQNAVAGMQRFSDTAEKTLPAPSSTPDSGAESADAGASSQADTSNPASPAPDTTTALGNTSPDPAASKDQSPDSTSTTPATNADGSANPAAATAAQSGTETTPGIENPQDQAGGPHPALANTPQQALQDAANGKKAYLYDPQNGIQFKLESAADGLKQALQDGVVDKDWAAQHLQEFQSLQDHYQALQNGAGNAASAAGIPGFDGPQPGDNPPTPQEAAEHARRQDAASARMNFIQQRLQQLAQYPELTSSETQERKQLQSEGAALDAFVAGNIPAYQSWLNDQSGPDADAQAKQIIADRDNPAAGTRAAHFNYGSSVVDDQIQRECDANILFDRAHPDGGSVWDRMKRGVGQFISSDVPAYMGMRQQDIDAVSKADQARQLIGNLTNAQDVKDVLASLGPLTQTLDAGGNIVAPANVQHLVEKIGYHSQAEADAAQPPVRTQDQMEMPVAGQTSRLGLSKSGIHFSLTLGEAQAYLNALREDDPGASGSVTANAFNNSFPLVTSGDIAIDENDKQQVAQRAALSMAIGKEISQRHGGAQMTGGIAGGLASFLAPEMAFKNLGAVGKLGQALNEIGWAKSTESGIDTVSKAATIATLAEGDELKANPQSQPILDNLVGAAARAFAMATSMKAGGAVENEVGAATKGLGAVPRVLAGGAASGLGLTAAGAVQQAMEGQDPTNISAGQLGANAGIGLGMSLLGLRAQRGEPAFNQASKARDSYINALTAYNKTAYDPATAPPGVSDLMAHEAALRPQIAAANGIDAQDPLKAQLLQNLATQKAALDTQTADPAALRAAQANASSGGAPFASGGQTVPGGTNPPQADAARAATPPQAQASGETSDVGKANAPGSGAPQASDGSPPDAQAPEKASGTDSAGGKPSPSRASVEKDIDAVMGDKSGPGARNNSPPKGRIPGTPFTNYNGLKSLLAKHNVYLSDGPVPALPGQKPGAAAFLPVPGGRALFYINSDASKAEVLHELGHFVDWLVQGKPGDAKTLSEQAAYDFIRNNPNRWQSLNDAEQEHAHFYLISKGGIPNLRKSN